MLILRLTFVIIVATHSLCYANGIRRISIGFATIDLWEQTRPEPPVLLPVKAPFPMFDDWEWQWRWQIHDSLGWCWCDPLDIFPPAVLERTLAVELKLAGASAMQERDN
jgi:hypothetical protein